ncbi:uncharacterized protein N7459_003621 [Penicillium hispanicum]|uniref:uncharacterized protein n=1 Tax=Penicillium hispanicum TaxID=1080232 RepID=UPI002541F6DC|nr:uncharacterized protein N7459_003621 [Penicillium hispanicum]KAJ5587856.1 hypothetical protein N7459_003621 [Penicillium hispanicum]
MKVCPNVIALLGAVQETCPVSNSACCTALYNSPLNANLLFPSHPSYRESIHSHYAVNARLYPACILQPRSAQEVSQAVTVLVEADDDSPQCKFAVRSGGHTTWAGAAGVQDGVTIDLSLMNATTYHAENSTASIMAGARWASVYKTLKEYGVAVTGGRSDTLGVGGLVTGGGLSYFAARDGFVCDNIESMELVLASGEIVTASTTSHADLFRAQKGGSNNFGIITKVNLRAFAQGDLWGGIIVHDMSTVSQQISALVNFTNRVEEDPNACLVSFWQYSSQLGTTIAATAPQYLLPVENPEAYRELLAIPSWSSSVRYADIYDLMMETSPPAGKRVILLTLTFGNDERVLQRLVDTQGALVEEVKPYMKSADWNFVSFLQPFPALFGQKGKRNGGNVLGIDRMTKNHLGAWMQGAGLVHHANICLATMIVYLLFLSWDDSRDDSLVKYAGDRIITQVREYAASIGEDHEYIYLNYADRSQNPLRGYGADNLREILRVAKKYDPAGVFQTQMPGGFKVSQA